MEISSRLVHNTPLPETGDDLPAAYFSAAPELTTLLGALGECDEIPRVVVGLNILLLVEEWIKSPASGIWTCPKIFQRVWTRERRLALIRPVTTTPANLQEQPYSSFYNEV